MLKKSFFVIFANMLALLLLINTAYAAPLMTSANSDKAQVMESSPVSLISLKATVDVGINNSQLSLQYVIKNESNKNLHITMGYLENIAKVYNFSKSKDIYINGQLPKGNQVVKLGTGEYDGLRWMTWPVDIAANQTLVIKGTLQLHNKLLNDGTQAVDFPLKTMSLWKGNVSQIEITFRFPQPMVYALDPNPQPTPTTITDEGSLIWRYSDVEPSEDIVVHFKPTEFIASERLRMSGSGQLKSIAQAYNNDDFVNVINIGEKYLSSNPSAKYKPLVELLMAQAYAELLQIDKASELYDNLLSDKNLDDLSLTVKQEALFYKYTIAQKRNDTDTQKMVLEQIEKLGDDESTPAFKSWTAEQKIRVEAASIVKEAQEKAAKQAAQEAARKQKFNLNRPVTIAGFDIPLKFILIAIALIAVIILISVLNSRRKKRKKHMPRW